jgi:hypothetical protein
LLHVRLRGENFRPEAGRERHLLHRLVGQKAAFFTTSRGSTLSPTGPAIFTLANSGFVSKKRKSRTPDLGAPAQDHPQSFATIYSAHILIWCEHLPNARDAIACETRIKGLTRAKKEAMIREQNPRWEDLSEGWDD